MEEAAAAEMATGVALSETFVDNGAVFEAPFLHADFAEVTYER